MAAKINLDRTSAQQLSERVQEKLASVAADSKEARQLRGAEQCIASLLAKQTPFEDQDKRLLSWAHKVFSRYDNLI